MNTVTCYKLYPRGREREEYLQINMDSFFPCTQQVFKSFWKIVNDTYEYFDTKNGLLQIWQFQNYLKVYFTDRIADLKHEQAENKALYQKYSDTASYARNRVKDKTFPNGLPVKAGELERFKAEYKEYTKKTSEIFKKYKQNQRDIESFQKYINALGG